MTAMVDPLGQAEIEDVRQLLTIGMRSSDSGSLRDRAIEALTNQRELYAEMHNVLESIEAAFGVMTATPASTIRKHGVDLRAAFDRANEDLLKAGPVVDQLRVEVADLTAEKSRLEERQQEHLRMIATLSQTVPLDSEVREALNQRGALLAQIGTLRSELAAAKASDESHADERMREFVEYKKRRNEQHEAYDVLAKRFTGLYEAWFGIPGAMTGEIMKSLRAQYGAMEQAKFDAEERERGLLRKIQEFIVATTAQAVANEAAETANENMESMLKEMLDHVVDKYGVALAQPKMESADGQ